MHKKMSIIIYLKNYLNILNASVNLKNFKFKNNILFILSIFFYFKILIEEF